MSRNSKWTDELIEKLQHLYKEKKYSTKQIGEILGFSKNAIVGKIHRLELNKSINSENNTDSNSLCSKIGHYSLVDINDTMCVWPFGEDKDITFCGKPVVPNRYYCKEHLEKAYLRFNKKNIKKD